MEKVYEIADFGSTYGKGHVGLRATQTILSSEVIIVERPLVHIATSIGSTNEKAIAHHNKIFAPEGSHVSWTTEDAKTMLGGNSSSEVQITIRLIMHHEEEAKKLTLEVKRKGYIRNRKGTMSTPSTLAYSLFLDRAEKYDKKFWDLANFERLYAHVSHVFVKGDMIAGCSSLGFAYCQTVTHINHSCVPNAHVKLLPNECYVIALRDIRKGDEITIGYSLKLNGFALPEKIRVYNKTFLKFDCKCGSCQNIPNPIGYEKGIPRVYDEGFKLMFKSLLTVPKGIERLSHAYNLFNKRSELFSAEKGGKEYDILVAFKVSSMVIEMIHESNGINLSKELSVVFEQACDILMACSEMNDQCCHPIWICRAVFGRLQLSTIKLSMAIDNIRDFDTKNAGNTPALLAIEVEEKKKLEKEVNLHSIGFSSEYLLLKEVFTILYGPLVGQKVLDLELVTCPTTELYRKDLSEFIKQQQDGMGLNAYRQAKDEVIMERYMEQHSSQDKKKKICKAFLLGICKKGLKCKRFHDQDLKASLDEQDQDDDSSD